MKSEVYFFQDFWQSQKLNKSTPYYSALGMKKNSDAIIQTYWLS